MKMCRLNRGVVELIADHKVCTVGQRLDPDRAAILRIFQRRMSTFNFKPIASWQKEGMRLKTAAAMRKDTVKEASSCNGI